MNCLYGYFKLQLSSSILSFKPSLSRRYYKGGWLTPKLRISCSLAMAKFSLEGSTLFMWGRVYLLLCKQTCKLGIIIKPVCTCYSSCNQVRSGSLQTVNSLVRWNETPPNIIQSLPLILHGQTTQLFSYSLQLHLCRQGEVLYNIYNKLNSFWGSIWSISI